MTTRKHLKRRVRTRAAQTGQSYATALRDIRREIEEKPMPAAPDSIADVIASCSFCGKSDRQVARIVAGPGVYICNECVALSATIMAEAAAPTPEDTERRRAEYRDRPAEEILALLPHVVKGAARMEAELAGWVSQLLAKGTDWSAIAAAVGIGEDEARRRFDPSR